MTEYIELDSLPAPAASTAEEATKWREAKDYLPSTELKQALELAIGLTQPLLITGEPGCGKTSAAYWAAWRMGLPPERLFHVQVRSDSSATKMRYEFDFVSYFRESIIGAIQGAAGNGHPPPDRNATEYRRQFIDWGPVARAFRASASGRVVLLFDEIDKAPRDFPNDLLNELDAFEIEVSELQTSGEEQSSGKHSDSIVRAVRENLLCVITSNAERDLPGAFLRRCLHHHLTLTPTEMRSAARQRATRWGLNISDEFLDLALKRYLVLVHMDLQHRPSFAEMLVWLKALATRNHVTVEQLRDAKSGELAHLAALLKHPEDLARVRNL